MAKQEEYENTIRDLTQRLQEVRKTNQSDSI